jgi:hypothetical protein
MAARMEMSEVSALAWQRYEKIKKRVEPKHRGEFMVIEVKSGDYFIDQNDMQAIKKAQAAHPKGTFYLIRIGYRVTHKFK